MDNKLRKLERLVAQGDIAAMAELSVERIRSGLPIIPSFFGPPEETGLPTAYFVFPTRVITVCIPGLFGELVLWIELRLPDRSNRFRAANLDKVVFIDVLDADREALLSSDLTEGWENQQIQETLFRVLTEHKVI